MKRLLCHLCRVQGVDAFGNRGRERNIQGLGWEASECRYSRVEQATLHPRIRCIHDCCPRCPESEDATKVIYLSFTDVAMANKRFDDRQSCHVLQLSDIGILGNAYSAMLTTLTPELQQTNACHGKWLLPDAASFLGSLHEQV